MSDITPTEAAALVEADKQRRVQAAAEAVQAALREYQCDLLAVVVPVIAPDLKLEMRARIDIVAR